VLRILHGQGRAFLRRRMINRWVGIERLSPSPGLHRFFAADDIAHIDAPADLVHPYGEPTDAALINIPLLHAFFRNRLRFFLGHFLLCHG
jgi:hypothetical protein